MTKRQQISKLNKRIEAIRNALRDTGHPSTSWVNKKLNELTRLEVQLLRELDLLYNGDQ
jgi:hypothetical protein